MEKGFFRFIMKDFLSLKHDVENNVFSSTQWEMYMYVYPLWWSCSIKKKKAKQPQVEVGFLNLCGFSYNMKILFTSCSFIFEN